MGKKLNLVPNEKHLENSRLARLGIKPSPSTYQARKVSVTLEQNEEGEWFIRLGKSKNLLPATDAEVALWLQIQELRTQLEKA